MYLSTQPYITATETAVIQTSQRTNPISYPQEFNEDIAELFGYILVAGTLTWSTVSCELNFSDCKNFTEMPKRIEEIYFKYWGTLFLRKNNRNHPKLCGRKTLKFISFVFGGEQYLKFGNEKVPDFVYQSPPTVVLGFLKGILGSCPKIILNSEARLILSNQKFLMEIKTLVEQYVGVTCEIKDEMLFLNSKDFETVKQALNLQHPSWWTSIY